MFSQQLVMNAGALAIDLIRRGSKAAEDRFGEGERHFTFAGKHHISAGALKTGHLAEIGGARQHPDTPD